MREKLKALAAMCCAMALCVAFAGCAAASLDKSLYTGEWTLDSSSDRNLDAEAIAFMRSIGKTIDLSLSEDGSGTMTQFGGAQVNITWSAKSNAEGTITIDGGEIAMTLEDGKLTWTDSGNVSMTFVKKDAIAEADASSAAASSSEASASASAGDAGDAGDSGAAASSQSDDASGAAADAGSGESAEAA